MSVSVCVCVCVTDTDFGCQFQLSHFSQGKRKKNCEKKQNKRKLAKKNKMDHNLTSLTILCVWTPILNNKKCENYDSIRIKWM